MNFRERAIDKFINKNQEALEDAFYDYCMENCPERGHVNHMKEVLHEDVFFDWVVEHHEAEINIIEEILKQEKEDEDNCTRDEYREQVEADYKLAQTGKH